MGDDLQCPNHVVCGGTGTVRCRRRFRGRAGSRQGVSRPTALREPAQARSFESQGGRCLQCNMTLGENLDIAAAGGAEACGICMEAAARVRLPQCSHRFCEKCVWRLFYGSDAKRDRYQLQGTLDSHMSQVKGRDKGCPICREPTLQPAWLHTGAADCRCARCSHACAACGTACAATVGCDCRVLYYCGKACRRNHAPRHRAQCLRDQAMHERRRELVGCTVRLVDTYSKLFGTEVWTIAAYIYPKASDGGSYSLESRGTTSVAMRTAPAQDVLDAFDRGNDDDDDDSDDDDSSNPDSKQSG
ncbi:hypothetical protein M885DRAFT_548592 [Pelagophyceae sp. CCMP2097]|nr:hypothetical protein M885DRAFT_548592 [Pelagophyceae sp. CCMP2097]